MSAPVVATPVSARTSPRFSAIAAAAVFAVVAGVSLMALTVWNLSPANNSQAVATQSYAIGYPMHGGLAGPSRISVFDQHPLDNRAGSFGDGYPLHGGLAGPSRVGTSATSSYGIGYPLHGGLAGASLMSLFDRPTYPHGGFAGPSRANEDR